MGNKRQSIEISYIRGFTPWSMWHTDETANESAKLPVGFFDWTQPSEEALSRYVPAGPDHETWFGQENEIHDKLYDLVWQGLRPGAIANWNGLKEAAQREGRIDLYLRAKRKADVYVLLAHLEVTVLRAIYRLIHRLQGLFIESRPSDLKRARVCLRIVSFTRPWRFDVEDAQHHRGGLILTAEEFVSVIGPYISGLEKAKKLMAKLEPLSDWPIAIRAIQENFRLVMRRIRALVVGKLEAWEIYPVPLPERTVSIWQTYKEMKDDTRNQSS